MIDAASLAASDCLAFGRGTRPAPGEVDRRGRAQQNSRHTVLRGPLGPCVAPHAIALLAATNPEPSLLPADHVAVAIEQGKPNGAIGGRADEERAVGFDRGRALRENAPALVHRLGPDRGGGFFTIAE